MDSSTDIQRICLKAKPSPNNREFHGWQTASIVIFVPENDRQLAVEKARLELTKRNWDFISYDSKSTLIENLVKEEGGEVWEAYQKAKRGEIFFKIFPDHFMAGKNEPMSILLPARVSELFMDEVIKNAGGRRLNENERPPGSKNADYLFGNFVFELKDLQEEGLEKESHQKKLAELFMPYFPDNSEVRIDPSILSEQDTRIYLDIIGAPIKSHVRSAAKQIKSSKKIIRQKDLLGGLILLNTGFGTFPDTVFAEQVERYANKDSKQFSAVISICAWTNTNGFDSYVFYRFSPSESNQQEVMLLKSAFENRFERMMTDLVQGKIPESTERATPLKPVTFTHAGIDFSWVPPINPLPWNRTDR